MNFKSLAITLVCVILGIILSLQYKSVIENSKLENQQKTRVETLKDEVLLEKRNNENLRQKLAQLESQRTEFEKTLGDSGLIEKNLKKELEYARIIAGLTDVKGKGLEITLDDTALGKVDDTDILNIVNELRASEAQAISVNDQRIVALSEIRQAGNYIVVNGRQIIRPYVIRAIADPGNLESALKIVGGIIDGFKEIYNIKYEIVKKDEIKIPKVDSSMIKTNYLEVIK